MTQLSIGALQDITRGIHVEKPVVKLLAYRKMIYKQLVERYRLMLDDGKQQLFCCVLAQPLNKMILNNELKQNSIIQLEEYYWLKHLILITKLKIIDDGNENVPDVNYQYSEISKTECSKKQNVYNDFDENIAFENHSKVEDLPVSRIEHLISLFENQRNSYLVWNETIKVYITEKSNKMTWKKYDKEGTLFFMRMKDDTGIIKAVAFNQNCEKFYDIFEINKTYLITNGKIKRTKIEYASTSKYEILFTEETNITPIIEVSLSSVLENSMNEKANDKNIGLKEIQISKSTCEELPYNLWKNILVILIFLILIIAIYLGCGMKLHYYLPQK